MMWLQNMRVLKSIREPLISTWVVTVISALFLMFATVTLFSQVALSQLNSATVFPLMTPRLSSSYGWRRHPIRGFSHLHSGIDLAAPQGTRVRSIKSGQIIYAGPRAGYGRTVSVRHSQADTSIYAHLDTVLVRVGERVRAGAVIGTVGRSGLATGLHLHFEWRRRGRALDPLKVFPALFERAAG